MPRNNRRRNNQRRNQQRKPRRRNRRRGRRRRTAISDPYIQMQIDPCNATNVPGLYGSSEGLLGRFKNNHQLFSEPNGFFLWAPDFHNQGLSEVGPPYPRGTNVWSYQTANTGSIPTNTPTLPYGYGDLAASLDVTTTSYADPAYSLVNSDLIQDARIVSACMQMTYYGSMKNSAGEVAFISNLPLDALLSGGPGDTPLTVDWLMNYATHKQRLGIDTLENVYRLNEQSSDKFKDTGDFAVSTPDGGSSEVDQVSSTLAPRVFGFVWRSVQVGEGISFDLTKSIEWRAKPASGLTQSHIHRTGPSQVPRINAMIDRLEAAGHKVWERTKATAASLGSTLAMNAYTGILNRAGTTLERALVGGAIAM